MDKFTHLHVHSQYSILDGMSKVPDLIKKCRSNGMNALALTDHGVMYGIKDLFDTCNKLNGAPKKAVKEAKEELKKCKDESKIPELEAKIADLEEKAKNYVPFKPIIGVEAYCARRRMEDMDKTMKAVDPETGKESTVDRSGWHLILLAKNKTGYKNLCRLVSDSWTRGFYGKPRIDKELLTKCHEGLIVCSACLGGEVPQYILGNQLDKAEESILWFKNLFGEDYYLELQRHKTDKPGGEKSFYEKQQIVNPHLIEFAKKHNIKVIATNDVHFVEEAHAEAHDRLICLSTASDYDDPRRMHYSKQEWLKTPEEMAEIFSDIPEALSNTQEIVEKVEVYDINSGPIMPKFPIPEEFGTEEEYRKKFTDQDLFEEFTRDEKGNVVLSQEEAEKKIKGIGGYEKLYRIKLEADYLNKTAWEGAVKRYGENFDQCIGPDGNPVPPQEVKDRITFELHIMKTMGFPGYFLIVADYIRGAREELDVWVGPGRGSAAGSVVAYCLWITNVDPLKYDLLFERFLNPDRISLPDIDVDFEDCGRGKVLDWVTDRYGFDHVAHIVTYGTMATKSSIKDLCRIQKIPLETSNTLCKLVPDKEFPDTAIPPEDMKGGKKPKINLRNCFKYVPELKEARYGDDLFLSETLSYAETLEDTIRQTGIHACGVIIGADDLAKFAPLATIKDKATNKDIVVTEYDGHVVESVGLIKMDFLGLSTLTLQKEACKIIKKRFGIEIDMEAIPIDDELTFKLFSEGRTIGIFQFESPGMQKYLKDLQPTVITDLIAMNALYRPGPIAYIPTFIERKHGREPITYDIPIMETYLKDTYGVTVYQEQVMLLSRLLANFTRGQSDMLRKAMGKKLFAILEELKAKFLEGGQANGHDPQVLEKIWKDWEAFASYAFNKSHSTCYAWVAYQTGYLKAHYPAEYMAANLTLNKNAITDVTKLMAECKEMKLTVKGPNVNESDLDFTVNNNGEILFGLSGVKGVGEGAVEAIIRAREQGGEFKDIYDFVERVDLRACNRKTIEALAIAGAFDNLPEASISRESFFAINPQKGMSGSEIIVNYGTAYQKSVEESTNSLFGDALNISITRPEFPNVEYKWTDLERLNKEKEVVGIYLTSHPLSKYKFEMKYLVNTPIGEFTDDKLATMVGKQFITAGIVLNAETRISQKGNPWTLVTIEDDNGKSDLRFFGNDHVSYANYFTKDAYVCVMGAVELGKYDQKPRIRYTNVCYLSELANKNPLSKATITIDIKNITPELEGQLQEFIMSARAEEQDYIKGNRSEDAPKLLSVRFRIVDNTNKREISLVPDNNFHIAVDNRIIDFIERTEELSLAVS
ncbi:MAG: DNA polymerase III subunit alpha [Bacteroidia bacterium]|nr:DNA polymerase III subunit alpha [Bacteroidia bacterium]